MESSGVPRCLIWGSDDLIVSKLRDMFQTAQTLTPGVSIRSFWRIDPTAGSVRTDGKPEVNGMPRTSRLTLRYTSHDPSHPKYEEAYIVSTDTVGLTPVASSEPNPSAKLTLGEVNLHKMLGRIDQSNGELLTVFQSVEVPRARGIPGRGAPFRLDRVSCRFVD